MATNSDVTLILERLRNGEEAASEALIPLFDGELRSIVARCLKSERVGHAPYLTAFSSKGR